ncbi:MAG: amidase family protein, partial [Gemmatimonadota bacterium]
AAAAAGLGGGERLAYCPDVSRLGVAPEVEAPCRAAARELERTGSEVEEVELDLSAGREAFLALRGLWMVVQHRRRLGELDRLGENLAGNIRRGLTLTAQELAAAEEVRGEIWHALRTLFERFDALLTPCTSVPPFPVEEPYPKRIAGREMETYVDWIAPTFVFSLAGLPALSVPCGRDARGLPVGLQVVGPPRGEERVLAVGAGVQRRCPVGRPPL